MAGELLHVAQGPDGFRGFAGGAGDEGAPSRMGGTARKAECRIQPVEPELHAVGAEAPAAFRVDDRVPGFQFWRACLVQRREGGAQLRMQRDAAPALFALGGAVFQVQRVAHLAFGVGDHGPGEGRDFLGAQAGLDREQEQDRIAQGVARGLQVPQQGGFLFGSENLGSVAISSCRARPQSSKKSDTVDDGF